MRAKSLFEVRRNPELNTHGKNSSVMIDLENYKNDDTFISFTQLPKIGLNPASEYNTPIGIYTYPLDETIIKQIKTKTVPYAGDKKYINVIKLVDPSSVIVFDGDTSTEMLISYVPKFIEYVANRITIALPDENVQGQFNKLSVEKITGILKDLYNFAIEDAIQHTPSAGFWNFTRLLSVLLSIRTMAYIPSGEELSHRGKSGVFWTKMFVDCGINGIIDYGNGIIHSNEPEQAVFFTTKIIKVLDRLNNPNHNEPRELDFATIVSQNSFLKILNRIKTLSPKIINDLFNILASSHDTQYALSKYYIPLASFDGKAKNTEVSSFGIASGEFEKMMVAFARWLKKRNAGLVPETTIVNKAMQIIHPIIQHKISQFITVGNLLPNDLNTVESTYNFDGQTITKYSNDSYYSEENAKRTINNSYLQHVLGWFIFLGIYCDDMDYLRKQFHYQFLADTKDGKVETPETLALTNVVMKMIEGAKHAN